MGEDGRQHPVGRVRDEIRWPVPQRYGKCREAPAHGPGGAHHPDEVPVLCQGAGGTDCGEPIPATLLWAARLSGAGPFRCQHAGAVPLLIVK